MPIKSKGYDGGYSLKQKGEELLFCVVHLSVRAIARRDAGMGRKEKYSDRIIHAEDSSHRQNRLSTSRPSTRFHREAGDTVSYQWFLVHTALNLSPLDNMQVVASSGKTSHELRNQHRHAQPLCATHYMWCPQGCSLQFNSLMRQEVRNLLLFGCIQSTAPPPPVCSWLRSLIASEGPFLAFLARLPASCLLLFWCCRVKTTILACYGWWGLLFLLQIAVPATPAAWAPVVETALSSGAFLPVTTQCAWRCTGGENKRKREGEKMTQRIRRPPGNQQKRL